MSINDPNLTQDQVLSRNMVALSCHLRAYALSLCRNPGLADDLVQDTMLKAWEHRAQYQQGTVLRAWMFAILRNKYLDDRRRSWRSCPLDADLAENTLHAISDPDSILALDEVRRGMAELPGEQRQALVLIGAGGFGYDEAAGICGASVGTIKSRTHRARARLRVIVDGGRHRPDGQPSGAALGLILAQVDRYSQGAAA